MGISAQAAESLNSKSRVSSSLPPHTSQLGPGSPHLYFLGPNPPLPEEERR